MWLEVIITASRNNGITPYTWRTHPARLVTGDFAWRLRPAVEGME